MPSPTPSVLELRWGSIDTEVGTFRDAKLWPGGGRGWDWNETGTRHQPGVQVADVTEILDHGVTALVVGCGQHGRLGVTKELQSLLRDRDIELVVEKTPLALDTLERLRQDDRAVGAVLHSTC